MKSFNVQSIVGKLSLKQKGEFRTIGEKSAHDWKQMVFLFALLCIVVIGAGLYLFVRIIEGDLFTVSSKDQASIKAVDQKDLESTTEYFRKRKLNLEYLEGNKTSVTDPSL